jgi:GH15 family glucan-1,4-alpha-glucosidase
VLASPVRTGNEAFEQVQHDIYGEVLNCIYELVRAGEPLDPTLARLVCELGNQACKHWREPDAGIWEMRGPPRHYVYTKFMSWVALDRAIDLAERFGLDADFELWHRERACIRRAILEHGYSEKVGAFVQTFDSTDLDASNLLLPMLEFLPFEDPRIQSTIDRTLEGLVENGLVYRYLADDGLEGHEGTFGLMTFWLVDALAYSGRLDEAHALYTGMIRRANHLGLFSEQIDAKTGAFLGNFPQAFTHIGLIDSAIHLAHASGRQPPIPPPIGSKEHRAERARR